MSRTHLPDIEHPWTRSDSHLDRDLYIRCALSCYRITPTTDATLRREDRLLAAQIYEQGVSIELLQAALIHAAARRSFRDPTESPLAPIRSLRYFLPLIEEITNTPIDPDYIRHLELSLLTLHAGT